MAPTTPTPETERARMSQPTPSASPLRRQRQGIAMIAALALLTVAAGVMTLMFARSVNEARHAGDDAAIVQTLMLARGGASVGGAALHGSVRDELSLIVQAKSSPVNRWSFGSGSGDQPDPDTVVWRLSAETNPNSVAAALQDRIDSLFCGQTLRPAGATAAITLTVFVTSSACGQALPRGVVLPEGRFVSGEPRSAGGRGGQTYALPFVLVTTARAGTVDYQRRIVLQGEYQFVVGRESFARYALFTNTHATESGSGLWFTDKTLFDGPVHTNTNYRFYRTPWFGGKVTSAGCRVTELADGSPSPTCGSSRRDRGATYFPRTFVDSPPADFSITNRYGTHKPELAGGVDWAAEFVPMPQNALDQKGAAATDGILIPSDLYSLTLSALDADGDPVAVTSSGQAPVATLQVIEACQGPFSCTTYRLHPDGHLEEQVGGSWVTKTTAFNGVVYVDGEIDRLTGPGRQAGSPLAALASFAQMTVVSERDTRITGDLAYEVPPCQGSPSRAADGSVTPAACDTLDAQNVLGVYSPSGDILIGNQNGLRDGQAPDDVTVHGVLMAGEGVIEVENYRSGSHRGAVNLLGGLIQNRYGAFGTFDSSSGTGQSGYFRKFTYDRRMADGFSPPHFPLIGQDGVRDVVAISFGQREQLY